MPPLCLARTPQSTGYPCGGLFYFGLASRYSNHCIKSVDNAGAFVTDRRKRGHANYPTAGGKRTGTRIARDVLGDKLRINTAIEDKVLEELLVCFHRGLLYRHVLSSPGILVALSAILMIRRLWHFIRFALAAGALKFLSTF